MLRNTARKRIVVAEDDPAVMELISVRLDLAGYHVVAARDGFQALKCIVSSRPSAMVLDIGMPRMNGFGVLKEIQYFRPRVPVLVLTARRSGEDVRHAIGLGADAYMVKPFDDKLLLDRIARLVNPPPTGRIEKKSAAPAPAQTIWEL